MPGPLSLDCPLMPEPRHPDAPARLQLDHVVSAGEPVAAIDLLAGLVPLSKRRLKDVMIKGAVWLTRARKGARRQRLRRATTVLQPGDRIELFYDAHIIDAVAAPGECLADCGSFSVWYKPPGRLAQGSDYGDHLSLLRQVEQQMVGGRQVWLLHRLDREAAGLMVFAHERRAAGRLSQAFAGTGVDKQYHVRVRGRLSEALVTVGVIRETLDGSPAETRFGIEGYDVTTDTPLLAVKSLPGRLHQIRRHFAGIGHPVMGDPRYGQGNADAAGLRLVATHLSFDDPVTGDRRHFELDAARAAV